MDVEEYPDDDDFEVEIVILKTINDEEGNEFLCSIEEDEEWERVADAWQEFMDERRFIRQVNPAFFIADHYDTEGITIEDMKLHIYGVWLTPYSR